MTLYEIDNQLMLFLDSLIDSVDENGEVKAVDTDQLDALNEARGQKIENIALYIKNLESEADAIKAEETRLKDRRISLENKADSLRSLLSRSMQIHGETKYSTARCAVSFRKSEAVIIDDIDLLDPEFKTEIIDYKIDKAQVKQKLKAGADISGAHIEERQNIQIK